MLDIVWRISFKGIRKEAGRLIGRLGEDSGSLNLGGVYGYTTPNAPNLVRNLGGGVMEVVRSDCIWDIF